MIIEVLAFMKKKAATSKSVYFYMKKISIVFIITICCRLKFKNVRNVSK